MVYLQLLYVILNPCSVLGLSVFHPNSSGLESLNSKLMFEFKVQAVHWCGGSSEARFRSVSWSLVYQTLVYEQEENDRDPRVYGTITLPIRGSL